MKNNLIKMFVVKTIIIILTISLSTSCTVSNKTVAVKNISEYPKTEFLPTLENEIYKDKNSVYCVTLLYAWQELRDALNTTFEVSTELQEKQKDLVLLNNSTSFKNTLDKSEYDISSIIKENSIKATEFCISKNRIHCRESYSKNSFCF